MARTSPNVAGIRADAPLMRVLVLGAGGLLANSVAAEFRCVAEVREFSRADLDISVRPAVDQAVAEARPDLIVNCAAFNDVDGAEEDARAALAVNALGVKALTDAAKRTDSAFVHYSTDFVFDGETTRPYTEEDEPRPRGTYGLSKLLGEWLALECPRAYVLRVESLFGPTAGVRRQSSLATIVRQIRAGEEVPVFVDRTVSPGYTPDIARATRQLVTSHAPPGLYHCVNGGAATWLEIAAEAARLLGRPLHSRALTLESVNLRASRPRYSALSTARLAGAGVVMPSWQDALARWLAD